MARLLIVVLCFVGLAAALPTLNLKNERVKRALDILKKGNFNRLTNRALKKENNLEDLTEELENLLKRGGGQVKGEGNSQGNQKHDPCEDIPENPLEDVEGYSEYHHWMHYLCSLRTDDASEAFAELTEQMGQATDLLMDVVNECTDPGKPVYTKEDLATLKELAEEAYEAGRVGQGGWDNWFEFEADTEALYDEYHKLEEKGMDAYNSERWTPLCTDIVTGLDREVAMLNIACYMYKLYIEDWL